MAATTRNAMEVMSCIAKGVYNDEGGKVDGGRRVLIRGAGKE